MSVTRLQNDSWSTAKNIPILEVAERLGITVLRNNMAACFGGHGQKTPCLSFSPSKNLWKCFSCGLGGSNIELVVNVLNYSPIEAVRWLLRDVTGNQRTRRPQSRGKALPQLATSAQSTHSAERNRPDPDVYEALIDLCPLDQSGLSYLSDRGFAAETIGSFRLAQLTKPKETERALRLRFEEGRLILSGLFRPAEGRVYGERSQLVWWYPSIIFPFISQGRITYLQARALRSGVPRYLGLNAIKTPLFNSEILGTLRAQLSPLVTTPTVFVCEGIPDTIAAAQLGRNAVGVLGAQAFRQEWVPMLLPFEIVIVPDGDTAGRLFVDRIRQAFAKYGKTVESLRTPPGRDLADLARDWQQRG